MNFLATFYTNRQFFNQKYFMQKKIIKPAFFIFLFISAFIFVGFYACNKDGGSNYGGANNNNGGNGGEPKNAVSIDGMTFSAGSLKVAAGTTVTWTNNDNVTHTVTADDGSFDSGNIAAGGIFKHTFSTAGTFNYHCTIHPGMKASVVVN